MNQFLRTSRKKRRVLVVDDELINRELLETILSLNYEVDSVSCGTEAMDALHLNGDAYSLILLDLLMPRMSGFEVIEACKADDTLKKIPIIVMTSEKSAEVRSIRMGADDFIAKPYRMPEVILARCERIIELSEEKALIRSIEKDKVTGLYIELFFDAYIRRLIPDLRRKTDAVVLTIEGLDKVTDRAEADRILKKTADAVKRILLGAKGIGCRTADDKLRVFCTHKTNYGELLCQLRGELTGETAQTGIRLTMAVCENVDTQAPIESWFEQAAACECEA